MNLDTNMRLSNMIKTIKKTNCEFKLQAIEDILLDKKTSVANTYRSEFQIDLSTLDPSHLDNLLATVYLQKISLRKVISDKQMFLLDANKKLVLNKPEFTSVDVENACKHFLKNVPSLTSSYNSYMASLSK